MKYEKFDKKFIDQQKQTLLDKKQRLEGELSKRGTNTKENPSDYTAAYQEYGDDEDSNAAEYAQTETNIGVVEQLEESLKKVNAALKRIEKGEYGIDIKSGKPINKRRLLANPSAEIDIRHEKK